MRVGIATDHGGYSLKAELTERLLTAGYEVIDFGADSLNPADDYPDFVVPLARAVAGGKVDRGIAVCGSGVGASICANKVLACARSARHRPLFRAAGSRRRSHEHPMYGRTHDRRRGRLGSRRNISDGRVQLGRTAPAAAGQSGRGGRATTVNQMYPCATAGLPSSVPFVNTLLPELVRERPKRWQAARVWQGKALLTS